MFEWDRRHGRVLASVWVVEEEVADAMRRLRSHASIISLTLANWAIGSVLALLFLPLQPLKAAFILLWFFASLWFATGLWENNVARAMRTWRQSFRSRVKEFGMESLENPREGSIRVLCTRARYTKVAPDGSLTDDLDDSPTWGYWVPGLGYMGWGHASADDAREAAVRRITGQLTAHRGEDRPVPVAVDIREQRETWLNLELWSGESISTEQEQPQNGAAPRRR